MGCNARKTENNDVGKKTVNNVSFSDYSLFVLSRNPMAISVKTVLAENFLVGTAGKIFAFRCKQYNVGSTSWYDVLKSCKGYCK